MRPGDLAADLAARVLRRVDVHVGASRARSAARTFGVTVTCRWTPETHGPQSGTADRAGDARRPRWMCAAGARPLSRAKVSRQVSVLPESVAVKSPGPARGRLRSGRLLGAFRAGGELHRGPAFREAEPTAESATATARPAKRGVRMPSLR